MTKKSKSALQELLNDLAKDGIKLVIGFIFSTALIGGASYLLFNIQPEVDEIHRLNLEINEKKAEAKFVSEMAEVYSNGFMSDENKRDQLLPIIDYLVTAKNLSQLDLTYVSETTKTLTANTLQLSQERGKIGGFKINDEQIKSRQQNMLNWYDNEIKLHNATYALIVNWEKETLDDRDKQILELFELMRNNIELINVIISQTDQVVYYIENVKMVEADQLTSEYDDKQSQLQIKKALSWVGIALGLFLIGSLAAYIKNQYLPKMQRKPKQKAG